MKDQPYDKSSANRHNQPKPLMQTPKETGVRLIALANS